MISLKYNFALAMPSLKHFSRRLLAAAQLFVAVSAGCKDARDCSLSGECVNGRCVCDVGWMNPTRPTDPSWYPPTGITEDEEADDTYGTPCSQFDLLPADPALPGYKNGSWPSWGGHPVYWSKVRKSRHVDSSTTCANPT